MNHAEITLLNTKLIPQRSRVQLIARPRLVSLLNSKDANAKVMIISGPAGYGKSTLISQYIQQTTQGLSAWYSLDEGDNNLDMFTQYFLAAYHSVSNPNGAALPEDVYQNSPNANPKARFTQLFNEIVNHPHPVRFVLDDFHLITNDRVLALIEWIVKSMPDQMSLVLTSREKPNLNCLPELAAQGNLVEINAKQLKFTLDETELFLSSDKAIKLNKQSLKVLYERTEGWVAATQLALHALQDQENQNEFAAQFSGSDIDIVNYLGAMVLSQQSEAVQHFFLYTSVLKRLSGPLCQVVTNNPNAHALLNQLSNDGLFLFELDRERKWFRYHHLFGEFLLARFKELEPQQYKSISLLAANWCIQQGDVHEAIDYYLMAQDFETAAKLIAQNVSQIVQYQGHHEVLFRWVDKLPLPYIRAEPKISICLAWSLIFTRNLEKVDNILLHIKEDHPPIKDETKASADSSWVQYSIDMLSAMHDAMFGRILEAQQKSRDWLQKWPQSPAFERGVVLGIYGATCIQTLDFKTARKTLREGKNQLSQCEAEYGVSWTSFLYALVLIKQGHIKESKHLLETALNSANVKMGEQSLGSTLLKLGLGYAYYVTHDLTKAEQYIESGFLSIEEHGLVDTAHIAFLTKSKLLLRHGDNSESMAVLYEAENFGRQFHLSHFATAIVVERIGRLLMEDKIPEANALFTEYGYDNIAVDHDRYTPYERIEIELLAVRLLLANKQFQEAVTAATKTLEQCQQRELSCESVSLSIIQIRAHFELGQENKSYRLLNKLINDCAQENLLSIFLEEQHYLAPLWAGIFKRYDTQQGPDSNGQLLEFIHKLRAELSIGNVMPAKEETKKKQEAVLEEALSKKEQEILVYLDQGLSNKELADTLFVSVSTIKWHLTHIYSKLGVKSRMEAIKTYQVRVQSK